MATKKKERFGELAPNELHAKQREMVEQIFRLKFQSATGQGEGLRKLRTLKKDLARVKTALRARELQETRTAKA